MGIVGVRFTELCRILFEEVGVEYVLRRLFVSKLSISFILILFALLGSLYLVMQCVSSHIKRIQH